MISHNFQFKLPVSIYFGRNSIEKLPEICKSIGSQALLVTSEDILHIAEKISNVLDNAKINYEKYFLESPEPDCDLIDSSAKKLSAKKFDFIIGVGGGSVIDMSKSLSIALTNPEPIWEYANLSYRPPKILTEKTIPVIAIPTTSGTGSEVTPYAVLSNIKKNQKGTIQQSEIFPKAAFVFPEFMISMPKELTASTGIDAFAHALESYMNISKQSPISEMLSIEAMKIIFSYLPKTIEEPNNIENRKQMAWASTLSGISIAHRGTTTAHAIAEVLGGIMKIPHSYAVAISTYPVLKETLPYAEKELALIYEHVFSTTDGVEYENAKLFVDSVYKLIKKCGLSRNLNNDISNLPENLDNQVLEYLNNYKFRPLKQHCVEFSNGKLSKIITEIIWT